MEKRFNDVTGVYFWMNGDNRFVGEPTTDEKDIIKDRHYNCIDTKAQSDEFYDALAQIIFKRYSEYSDMYIPNEDCTLYRKGIMDNHYHYTYTWYKNEKQVSSKEAFLSLAIMLVNKEE